MCASRIEKMIRVGRLFLIARLGSSYSSAETTSTQKPKMNVYIFYISFFLLSFFFFHFCKCVYVPFYLLCVCKVYMFVGVSILIDNRHACIILYIVVQEKKSLIWFDLIWFLLQWVQNSKTNIFYNKL